MENLFNLAEACLHQDNVATQIHLTHHARRLLDAGQLDFAADKPILPMSRTVFPARPQLLLPRDMPRRRFDTHEGQAAFFHALTHIEFIAIYLAWDILYRFRGLPQAFYEDWLCIADEEALHFTMLREHLLTFGVDYGDLPAHRGLWSHAEDTQHDVLARLAVVPRCMEARGLDVTPGMIEKFKAIGDETAVALLSRILTDEIGHVERGSYWFNFVCRQRSLDPETQYQQLLIDYYRGIPKGPFNRTLRQTAGFTHSELAWLEQRALQ